MSITRAVDTRVFSLQWDVTLYGGEGRERFV